MAKEEKKEKKETKNEAKNEKFKAVVKFPGYGRSAVVTVKIGKDTVALMDGEVIEVDEKELRMLNLATSNAVTIEKMK